MRARRVAIEVGVRRALEPTRRIGTLHLAPRDAVASALEAQSRRREHGRRLDAFVAVLRTLCDRLGALEQHVATIAATTPAVSAPPAAPLAHEATTMVRRLREGISAVAAQLRRAWHHYF